MRAFFSVSRDRRRRDVEVLTNVRRPIRDERAPLQEIDPNITVTICETWQREIRRSSVQAYLDRGEPPLASLNLLSLRNSAANFVRGLGPNVDRLSPEVDEILCSVIDGYAITDPLAGDAATVACLHTISKPAAINKLNIMRKFEIGKYLRCIVLAEQLVPQLASRQELRIAQPLLQILSGRGDYIHELLQLIEILNSGTPRTLLSLQIIQKALTKSNIRQNLQGQLDAEYKKKRFLSVYGRVSMLQEVQQMLDTNNDITIILDEYFPSWHSLRAWRPNIDRITLWENGERFTTARRAKLDKVFDLDGPDTATCRYGSLMSSDPECYKRLLVEPKTTENLDNYLDLLYEAHVLGPGALDLFIYLCINCTTDANTFSILDSCIRTGDDSYCKKIFFMEKAFDPKSNLDSQLDMLTQALSIPALASDRMATDERFSDTHLTDRLLLIMRQAQRDFCTQLATGTGSSLGTEIYKFGSSILSCSRLHPLLAPEFLIQLRRFPPRDMLDAIFDYLEDNEDDSTSADFRFKSFLTSTIGGNGTADGNVVTITIIENELQFWNHHQLDSTRKALAKKISKLRTLDYPLYTSCLLIMLEEKDIIIREMNHMISITDEKAPINLANYLNDRRGLGQLLDNCWLSILSALIREQDPSYLLKLAKSMSTSEWMQWATLLVELLQPIFLALPHTGVGLTRECLLWWETLSEDMESISKLVTIQSRNSNLAWLYFPTSIPQIMGFLEVLKQGSAMEPVYRTVLSLLAPNGDNISLVCDCIGSIRAGSGHGRAVIERILLSKLPNWPKPVLAFNIHIWTQSSLLTRTDKSALHNIQTLFKLPPSTSIENAQNARNLLGQLHFQYEALMENARELETIRLKFRSQEPRNLPALLDRLGIDNSSSGRSLEDAIPPELLDSIESVGDGVYELCFALTGLSDLQRSARGISRESSMLLVRVCYSPQPKFCIHFAPDDEGQSRHTYCQPHSSHLLTTPIAFCTAKTNLFTYYLARSLIKLFRTAPVTLHAVHSMTTGLISASPSACLMCCNSMGVKTWKPATCSRVCSRALRSAPLSVRLHNLLVDPLVIDLLLTCIYAAAADRSRLELLPGCPVPKSKLQAVINSFPSLAGLQNATDLYTAVRGTGLYRQEREDLLSWLCLTFRGFMLSAPDGYRVPSMPNTKQFLLINSHHEREGLFKTQLTPGTVSGPVFHGTGILRLFLILAEGIKIMSNTLFMTYGAASGAGVYCGDEQSTSIPYAGNTGTSWRHSALGNMKIMLGLELASYVSTPVHVISDQNRLLVRYVFLLPQNFTPPPRRHVDVAMNAAFARLRSGLNP